MKNKLTGILCLTFSLLLIACGASGGSNAGNTESDAPSSEQASQDAGSMEQAGRDTSQKSCGGNHVALEGKKRYGSAKKLLKSPSAALE